MKSKIVFLTAALAAVACSTASAEGFFVEAGVGHVVFNDGDYSLSSILPPDPAANENVVATSFTNETFTVDDSSTALFVAGGYRVSDWLSLRLAYQHFDRTTSVLTNDVVIAATGADAGSITMAYSDEVQVVSFAPEFRWQATPRFALLLSPQLNWVFSDAQLRTDSNSPLVLVIPLIERSADELTLGGSVGAEFAMSDRLDLTARYHYMDIDVSWGRQADLFAVGLKYDF